MIGREKILIIDANALGHVVKHATKELSWRGDRTGVIFGFIQKLIKIQSEVMSNRVIFCWDAKKETLFRRGIFPEYKVSDAEPNDLDKELDRIARPQFDILRREVLPSIGFRNNFIYEGLEADDIIAEIANREKILCDIIIVSRDNDLHQLLDGERVVMFDPVKFGYFNEKIFTDKWGIGPESWDFVKAIAGCGGDGVPGVPGVKEKTAIKWMKGELKQTTKAYKAIMDLEEKCVFNLRLVKIPWESTPRFEIYEDFITVKGFIDVCKKYGFNSFLEGGKFREFEELFCRRIYE